MTDEELIGLMASAMAASKAHDDEGEFDMLCDLIGFSGENKTRTVLKEAARAALAVAKRELEERQKIMAIAYDQENRVFRLAHPE